MVVKHDNATNTEATSKDTSSNAGNNKRALPALTQSYSVDPKVATYLEELKQSGFDGDIEQTYASRLAMATDNSVYQQLPQAVVHPKHTQDVQLIGRVGAQDQYQSVTFSARGGGTGTNGQSLTKGIVVDMSRHMNKVLEINEAQAWVRVQSGVVKDQLNDAVRQYGYFFSPDLSTSNRATIGGMVNTDASGQGSLKYGKTSDHVLSLQAVFADGSVFDTQGDTQPEFDTLASKALLATEQICRENRAAIEAKFPPLNRFLTGYDLKNALQFTPVTSGSEPEDTRTEQGEFDLARVLCGAEGSLAFITEAKLNLTKIPKARTLINVKYNSFDAALRNAPFMVQAQALSVETIDSKVLNLAKQDIVWHTVSDLLTDVEGKDMQGINIIEFADPSEAKVHGLVEDLVATLKIKLATEQGGIIGFQVCSDLDSINKIYNMRKKAVGLLGGAKGRAKPIAFAEDTCVPPENLADYIAEFRTLLDGQSLNYGMFGHVDAGVLHVRPALDLCDPEQEKLMHQISDDVVKLVAKYGGLMWGEHGKGYRSEYGPEFFGDELFMQLRRVKTAFDPLNKMNPGKICTPVDSDDQLVKVSDTKRAFYDRQIPVNVRDSFNQAMDCNGNGLCFNYDVNSPMCPSMKITADRRHSPKGRAGLVREWLRQLTEQGIDVLDLEQQTLTQSTSIKTMIDRIRHSINKKKQYDFSHEVYDALNGCLACKACASQCPINVDVPSFRSRFLNLYYSRYQRPAKDYLVANIESLLPLMASAPKVVNGMLGMKWVQSLTKASIGYIDTPLLSVPTLKQQLSQKQWDSRFSLSYLQALSEQEKQDYVLVVQDPFTSYYDAQVVSDFVALAVKLGKKPIILPFKPNGKAQHIKGFLKQFTQSATTTAEFLNDIAKLDIPLVGIDPAMVLCYRDEYKEVLGEQACQFRVLSVHEWLQPNLECFNYVKPPVMQDVAQQHSSDIQAQQNQESLTWYLFSHCTEKTKLPNAEKEWGQIFQHFGAQLQSIAVGCCGMAGTFGHEADKFDMSQGIYQLSWQPNLNRLPKERCLSTGYSCRSQVKRFEGEKLRHPLQALLSIL
ncbi:D-2-hydroxyglutarate dehydrogenase YdiJ [Vibrio algicola]|uniref:D-2-hydroxyglutarate dehydrogenase n=1 Tax=Vibrio algicola TaxID=2662262 RepID=A0A5Q0TJA4_9VIBR|nr:FAD-binding and (Fe-S)-binding domain-containing protein [Vibrio algicola]